MKMKKLAGALAALAVASTAFISFATVANATENEELTFSVNPVIDTYVENGKTEDNSSKEELYASKFYNGNGLYGTYTALMKFDYTSILNKYSGYWIKSAELSIDAYNKSKNTDTPVRLYCGVVDKLEDNWDNSINLNTITTLYKNKNFSSFYDVWCDTDYKTETIDVLKQLTDVDNDGIVTFGFYTQNDGRVAVLASNENTVQNKPTLKLTITNKEKAEKITINHIDSNNKLIKSESIDLSGYALGDEYDISEYYGAFILDERYYKILDEDKDIITLDSPEIVIDIKCEVIDEKVVEFYDFKKFTPQNWTNTKTVSGGSAAIEDNSYKFNLVKPYGGSYTKFKNCYENDIIVSFDIKFNAGQKAALNLTDKDINKSLLNIYARNTKQNKNPGIYISANCDTGKSVSSQNTNDPYLIGNMTKIGGYDTNIHSVKVELEKNENGYYYSTIYFDNKKINNEPIKTDATDFGGIIGTSLYSGGSIYIDNFTVSNMYPTETWVFKNFALNSWLNSNIYFTYTEDESTTTKGTTLENFITNTAGATVPETSGEGEIEFAITFVQDVENMEITNVYVKKTTDTTESE